MRSYSIRVTFFKTDSGKFYAHGTALVSHYVWEKGFIEEVLRTQTAVRRSSDLRTKYYILTENISDSDPLVLRLFPAIS